MRIVRLNLIYFIISIIYINPCHTESNINQTQNEIVFGQSANLSGSMKLYGSMIQHGIQTYFNQINEQGGINGKKLRLVTLNDYGNPLKAEKNTLKLKKQGISMFFGNMGTRSLLKILPLAEQQEIGLYFPWGGGPELQQENLTHVVNGPGLLNPQLDAIVDDIINNFKQKKIAIFYADDDFSTDAKNYLVEILKKNSIEPVGIASYNRFTMDIAPHAQQLIATDPKIVICISTSMPTVRLINQFLKNGHYATTFFGVDATHFTSSILQDKGVSFFYSSAVPDPINSTIHIAQEYRKNLKKYFPDDIPNILSFTYYLSAAIICQAIKSLQEPISNQAIIRAIENMKNYNLRGFMVDFNPKNRHVYGETIAIVKGS